MSEGQLASHGGAVWCFVKKLDCGASEPVAARRRAARMVVNCILIRWLGFGGDVKIEDEMVN